MSSPDSRTPRRGGVKFVLLHHGTCTGGACHHRIDAHGQRHEELSEAERGQHAHSIAVAIDGDFDVDQPTATQIAALKKLLLELKLRYPEAQLGAHRQVRGEPSTTCPGRRFPMRTLAAWAREELLAERDAVLRREFERQYSQI